MRATTTTLLEQSFDETSSELAEVIMRHPPTALALITACAALPTAAAPQTLAFPDVTIVDVREGVARSGMTVVVSGDRITAVGPAGAVAVPADARVVDGRRRFLIPGLWDMHVHPGSDRDTRDVIYPLFVAHGVTGIRNMGADCFDCQDSIERVHARRRAIAAAELIGPRVVASSDYAGSYEQAARRSTEGSSPQAPATEADARAFVRLVKERGVDFIKIYDMIPREVYFALAEEADRLGLPFAGHVPVEVRASEASDAGQRSIEHMRWVGILNECSSGEDDLRARLIAELYKAEMGSRHTSDGPALLPLMLEMVDTHDPEKCAALAERFVRNGTWVVPTLMTARLPSELESGWREDPYARFLPPGERRYFEWEEEVFARDLGDAEEQAPVSRWGREVTRAMHRVGVRILAGSDAGSTGIFWGIGLHQELELLVSAGLTEAEAIRAATLGPAEFLDATDSLGTVEPGKVADLVLLEANPLEDIRNTQRVAAVVANGRLFDRAALDGLLADVEQAANRPPEATREVLDPGDRPFAEEQGSIAVLPFADMSPAKDQEYFSDGIAEELQDVLAQLPELRVAFRTSAFAFKGKDVGIDSIARALNVRHVLEGSVRKASDRVRITTRLIDASTGDHLWSETYDRELNDVFQVQDEIAREIVDQLQLELGRGRAGAILAKEETKDPEAHVLLLRGRRLYRQFTREGFEDAGALLKQAIARDSTYARAHAELVSVYRNQADQRHGPVEALMGQARAALERALELDPNLARAHYVAGWIAYGSGDRHAAEASLARAVELNPGYAPAHALRAYLLAVLGRTEEAITAAERAAVLDPLSLARQTDVAATYIYTRQYERAAEAYQSALALDPGPGALGDLAVVYALMGRHAEAIRAGERARAQAPQEEWPLTALGYAYARAGRRTEAEAVLRTLEALPEPDPYLRAIVYAGLAERDRVFSLLERAVAERNALVAGLGVDPVFDPYRSDPRMERLLERVGLPAQSR